MTSGKIEKTDDDFIREAMHELPYGIYIIGTTDGEQPNGMIADWVMQVSFDPRLVAVAFERDSSSLARIRRTGIFTVNLLGQAGNGMALAAHFVQPADASKVEGRSDAIASQHVNKLEDVDYQTTADGCPILEDALAWLYCELDALTDLGDHVLVTGRVLDGEVIGKGDPLTSTYTGWSYSG
jgi:flavin reductase (DIM6/NTAB) family NADH-FMN oxidoreductase RutF